MANALSSGPAIEAPSSASVWTIYLMILTVRNDSIAIVYAGDMVFWANSREVVERGGAR